MGTCEGGAAARVSRKAARASPSEDRAAWHEAPWHDGWDQSTVDDGWQDAGAAAWAPVSAWADASRTERWLHKARSTTTEAVAALSTPPSRRHVWHLIGQPMDPAKSLTEAVDTGPEATPGPSPDAVELAAAAAPAAAARGGAARGLARFLKEPKVRVTFGTMVSLQKASDFTSERLNGMMRDIMVSDQFRWFAGRSILDFRTEGTTSFNFPGPFKFLKPLVDVLAALAERSLFTGEKLALIQLIINRYKDGRDEVKPHKHRCRQVCLALGAERELVVDGAVEIMRHGDCMPLSQETHSVPPAQGITQPRVSLCLFYGSTKEYEDHAISVNANDGWHGSTYWWMHPEDFRRPHR